MRPNDCAFHRIAYVNPENPLSGLSQPQPAAARQVGTNCPQGIEPLEVVKGTSTIFRIIQIDDWRATLPRCQPNARFDIKLKIRNKDTLTIVMKRRRSRQHA